uniref:Uncharacterized protein n=1 Tax=Lotharella globosa TaxID=91324 RepID=A0A7S3YGG2_9EUKA
MRRLCGARVAWFSTEASKTGAYIPHAEESAYVLDRRRYRKELNELRKKYMLEIEALEAEKATEEAKARAEIEAQKEQKRKEKAIRRAEIELRLQKEEQELNAVQAAAFKAQMTRWRKWKHDKQDELREELNCLLVKESPEWILDPEKITPELFDSQLVIEGFFPPQDPKHTRSRDIRPYETLLETQFPIHSRLAPQEENPLDRDIRKRNDDEWRGHMIYVEGEEVPEAQGFEASASPENLDPEDVEVGLPEVSGETNEADEDLKK